MYYTYMIRCDDNSLYTGITTDVKRRMKEHFERGKKCAKYTLVHHAKHLDAVWESENRVTASKLEFHIKSLSKDEKERLISNNDFTPLNTKLLCKNYTRLDINLYK